MTTFRSGRLEAILGGRVDELTVDALDQLVAEHVAEDFDLEFKGALYRNNEKGKSDLATDVCALANAAGGVIFLGIEEDNQARAVAAPGVAVSDDEYTRMLKIVASNTAPMPDFTIRPISNRMRGF